MFEQVLINAGMAGAIIVAWYFFNQGNMKAFSEILRDQAKREQQSTELVLRLIATQESQSAQQYQTLREMVETNQHLIGQMSDLKHMVATNQQCPIQRRELRNEG